MILEDKLKIAIVGLCLLTGVISPSRVYAENKEYNNLIHNITISGILSNISWVDLDNNGTRESIVKEYRLPDKKVWFYEKENSEGNWVTFAIKVSNSENYILYSSQGNGEFDKKLYGKQSIEIPSNLK